MKQGPAPAAGTIVLWEDDPVRQPLLAAMLEAAGLPVVRPRRAEQALALASAESTEVLVLDANVTRPSGAEFLRELSHRRRGRPPATVALLQPGQACLRATLRHLGAERIVNEPFAPAELIRAVRSLRRPEAPAE